MHITPLALLKNLGKVALQYKGNEQENYEFKEISAWLKKKKLKERKQRQIQQGAGIAKILKINEGWTHQIHINP